MEHQMRILQGLKLAAVLAVALSMGACANKNPLGPEGAMASAATPGSQQDFVVNVGDRVFFESDQTELSPQAIATLEKQAQRRTTAHTGRAARRERGGGRDAATTPPVFCQRREVGGGGGGPREYNIAL